MEGGLLAEARGCTQAAETRMEVSGGPGYPGDADGLLSSKGPWAYVE